MQISAVQFDIAWEDRAANFAKVRALATAGASPGGLIVLPELFSSGFSMDVEKVAERDPSEAEAFLGDLARETGCAVSGGLARRGARLGKNECVTASPEGHLLSRYQKNRAFTYTGEADHYEPGTELANYGWGGFKICPLICYDLRFPELFRRGAAAGVQLFTVIASWPVNRIGHWITLLKARAIENQAYVVGVNRIGDDPKWHYTGQSLIIDPHGEVLAEAGDREVCVRAEVDVSEVEGWRAEFPALKDMQA